MSHNIHHRYGDDVYGQDVGAHQGTYDQDTHTQLARDDWSEEYVWIEQQNGYMFGNGQVYGQGHMYASTIIDAEEVKGACND